MIVALALAVTFAAFGVAPISAAEPQRVTSTELARISVDRVTCGQMITELQKADSPLSAADRTALARVRDTECVIVFSEEVTPLRTPLRSFGTAATTCAVRQGNMSIYSGPVETYTARHAAYVCWNGTKVWYSSGNYMNCWVTAIPGFFGEATWCGVLSGNNTATLTLRHDFFISAYATLWVKRFGYQNTRITRTGSVSVTGFCCN